MCSIVTLNPILREVPYFQAFSPEEDIVEVPRPLINESLQVSLSMLGYITTRDLITFIENRVYLGMKNDESMIRELMWRLGETEVTWNEQSRIIQQEIKPYTNKKEWEYVYEVRCKIPINDKTCEKIAKFGSVRLLEWARSNGCVWNEDTIFNAHVNNHFELRDWAIRHGCPVAFGCQHVVMFGTRCGTKCGRKVDVNSKYCTEHISIKVPSNIRIQPISLSGYTTYVLNTPIKFVVASSPRKIIGVYQDNGTIRLSLSREERTMAEKIDLRRVCV